MAAFFSFLPRILGPSQGAISPKLMFMGWKCFTSELLM